MTDAIAEKVKAKPKRYFPVAVDSIDHATLEMDLYLVHKKGQAPALYRAVGVDFSPEDSKRLRQQGVEFLYIADSDHAKYRAALLSRLDRTFRDPRMAREERARYVKNACKRMVEDVLLNPGSAEPVAMVVEVSGKLATWCREDNETFAYLLDMSAHDYLTATHMVNVGIGCGLLAEKIYPNDPDTIALIIQGGLLHDVGKRGVPEDLLNKEGSLAPEEWAIVKRHPLSGHQELSALSDVDPIILEMIRDHHERIDGKGYPRGAGGSDLGTPARICAVVDVFDALTANRPYREGLAPSQTMALLEEGRGSRFDPRILDLWAEIVDREYERDPERVARSADDGVRYRLEALLPHSIDLASMSAHADGPTIWDDNRRRYERHGCKLTATAVFTRLGKSSLAPIGSQVDVLLVDISRSGAQIVTPWALTKNDLLTLLIPNKSGPPMERWAKVMRIRQVGDDQWRAGLHFIPAPE